MSQQPPNEFLASAAMLVERAWTRGFEAGKIVGIAEGRLLVLEKVVKHNDELIEVLGRVKQEIPG